MAGFHGLKSMATFGKSLRDCRGNGRERCSWAFARKARCDPGWYEARRWRWELSLFVSVLLLHPLFPFDGFGRPCGTWRGFIDREPTFEKVGSDLLTPPHGRGNGWKIPDPI